MRLLILFFMLAINISAAPSLLPYQEQAVVAVIMGNPEGLSEGGVSSQDQYVDLTQTAAANSKILGLEQEYRSEVPAAQ